MPACYHEFNSPSDACYAISCLAPWFSLVVVLPFCRWLLPLSRTGAATVGPHAWDPAFAAVSSYQTSAAGGGAPTSPRRLQGQVRERQQGQVPSLSASGVRSTGSGATASTSAGGAFASVCPYLQLLVVGARVVQVTARVRQAEASGVWC